MSGATMGHPHPAPSSSHAWPASGRKTLRRCSTSRENDNFVLIDVDSDAYENVIILDVPESVCKKLRRSSVLRKDKEISGNVICIDDDEGNDGNEPTVGRKDSSNVSDATPGFNSSQLRNDYGSTSVAFTDGCELNQENTSPVKISKGKRTYSGKSMTTARYGLASDSESSSYDYDPDCELMEDYFGDLRKQWEKASLKRKTGIPHDRPCSTPTDGETTASETLAEGPGVKSQRVDEAPFSASVSGQPSYQEEASSSSEETHGHRCGGPTCSHDCERPGSFAEFPSGSHSDLYQFRHSEEGSPISRFLGESKIQEKGSNPGHGNGTWKKYHARKCCRKIGQPSAKKHGPLEPEIWDNNNFSPGKAGSEEEEALPCRHPNFVQTEVDCDASTFGQSNNFMETASSGNCHQPEEPKHGPQCHTGRENLEPPEPSTRDDQSADPYVCCSAGPSCDKVYPIPEDAFLFQSPMRQSGVRNGKSYTEESRKPGPTGSSKYHDESGKADSASHCSYFDVDAEELAESTLNNPPEDPYAEYGQFVSVIDSCMISDREKLKETDEYKRALKEELASRQRVLQLQALEAQELKRSMKRKRSEAMRLLDMEKRQKQRVEEMRELQKRDEQDMNLKEVIRAEVRKELSKLENACHDLASLLRGLGINVGTAGHTELHEVRTAYKRALLTFHPDRAPRSDLRQLVEAEEKFKLVSRMKEKFMPTL